MRAILKWFRKKLLYWWNELKKPVNIAWLVCATLFLLYQSIKSEKDGQAILNDPATVYGEILRVKGCFKNGKCIDFKYEFEGETYYEDASVSWPFANWCKRKDGGCYGMRFRIDLERSNPENILVYWEEMWHKELQRTGNE